MKIEWREDLDDDGNTYWEGGSPYTDGEDGPQFQWRLVQVLEGNAIRWLDAHDSELAPDGSTWATLEEAKAASEEAHNNILISEL